MNLLHDIIWPDNIIRVRFLPLLIVKIILGIMLAPAVIACAGYTLFIIDPAWPRLPGRGLVLILIAVLALMVYLMLRFVMMLCADIFTSDKLIIKYQLPFRRSIRWKEISSIEIHQRKNFISVNTEDGKRYELKGFRGVNIRDTKIISDDYLERSSYEYRFHGLSTGITLNQYAVKLRRFIPEDIIINL